MTSSTKKLTVEGLKNMSPFTVKEAAREFGVKKNTVHHFLRYGLRSLMFTSRREKRSSGVGTPEKVYDFNENIVCPHCGMPINIMDLEDLHENNSR